jgi:hypothetical protein
VFSLHLPQALSRTIGSLYTSLSINKVAQMYNLLGTGKIVERVLFVKPPLPYLR